MKTNFKRILLKTAVGVGLLVGTLFLFGIVDVQEANAAPSIISRSEWGCNDPLCDSRNWSTKYLPATHIVIHHTVNDYSYEASKGLDYYYSGRVISTAEQVRNIWSYHTKTLGWGDIGYNYIIDGYGNIFEGRYGGEDVVAGHAIGYNPGTIGVAILGTYTNQDITDAAREALVSLIGRELAERGHYPQDIKEITARNVITLSPEPDTLGRSSIAAPRIEGHKVYQPKTCPGDFFYGTLGGTTWGIRYWSSVKYNQYRQDILMKSFSISDTDVVAGQTVTGTFTLKNNKSTTATIQSATIAGRLNGENYDFGYLNNFTLAPGQERTISFQKILDRAGTYSTWVSIKENNSWKLPLLEDGSKVSWGIKINSSVPTTPVVKVIEAPAIDPHYPLVGEDVIATFKVHNYGSEDAVFDALGLATRVDGEPDDFEWKAVTVPAGQDYTYTSTQSFSETGNYSSWVSSKPVGDTWKVVGGDGVSNSLSFSVYETAADPKVSGSLTISPQDPIAGDTVTASFKVKNYGDAPAYFYRIGVALRYDPTGVNENQDFSWAEQVVPGNSEKTLSYSKVLTDEGDYNSWISYYDGETWSTIYPPAENGITKEKAFTIYATAADPKVISSLEFSPENPVIGETVIATFTVKNFGDAPARFGALGVAVRYNGQNRDFPWSPKVINGGAEETIELTRQFTDTGAYNTWIGAYWPEGYWSPVPTSEISVQNVGNFSVSDIYDQLRITEFSVSPASPVVTENVITTVKIRNNSSASFTLSNFGVAVRVNPHNSFYPYDYPYQSVSFSANEEKTLTFTKPFNNYAVYEMFVTYYSNGKWYRPIANSGVSSKLSVTTHLPNLKVVSGLSISPTTPALGGVFTGNVGLKNFDSRPITVTTGVAVRYGNLNKDIKWNTATIAAGETYNYQQSRAVDAIGDHRSWVSYYLPTRGWIVPPAEPGATSSKTFSTSGHVNPTIQATSSTGSYYIKNTTGTTLATRNVWNPTYVSYNAGKYYVTSGSYAFISDTPIKIEGVNGAIIQLTNYTDLAWDNSNDNQFRGAIEIRYSSNSTKLWAINDINMEMYLRGIGETSASSPMEHLKVMSIASRTYARYYHDNDTKFPNEPFYCDNSTSCQVYKGYRLELRHPNLTSAVNATANKVVKYNDAPIVAAYSHGRAPRTYSAEEAGWSAKDYLVSVSDPYGATDMACGVSGNHCVGLSTSGSIGYINNESKTYDWILPHYYKGTYIGNIPNENVRISIYGVNY